MFGIFYNKKLNRKKVEKQKNVIMCITRINTHIFLKALYKSVNNLNVLTENDQKAKQSPPKKNMLK